VLGGCGFCMDSKIFWDKDFGEVHFRASCPRVTGRDLSGWCCRAVAFWCGDGKRIVGVWLLLLFSMCFQPRGYVSAFSEFSNIGESVLI